MHMATRGTFVLWAGRNAGFPVVAAAERELGAVFGWLQVKPDGGGGGGGSAVLPEGDGIPALGN